MANKAAKTLKSGKPKLSDSKAKRKLATNLTTLVEGSAAERQRMAKRPVLITNEPVAHLLQALLHTMRSIAQHEDELCTLLHDVRKRTTLSATLRRDLQQILLELPLEDYVYDLTSAQEALI